jgi:hypothetical protein
MIFARNEIADDPTDDPLNQDTQIGYVFVQIFTAMLDRILRETTTLKRTRATTLLPTHGWRRAVGTRSALPLAPQLAL